MCVMLQCGVVWCSVKRSASTSRTPRVSRCVHIAVCCIMTVRLLASRAPRNMYTDSYIDRYSTVHMNIMKIYIHVLEYTHIHMTYMPYMYIYIYTPYLYMYTYSVYTYICAICIYANIYIYIRYMYMYIR